VNGSPGISGHGYQRSEHVATHVHFELVFLQHGEHRAVVAELALGEDIDVHAPAGLGVDPVGHLLQAM